MKNSFVRILSMFLTLAMLSTILPLSAVSTLSEAGSAYPGNSASWDMLSNEINNASGASLSHEDYLKQQLESITLLLDDEDIMMAFGFPLSELGFSKPAENDVLTIDGGSPGSQGQFIINGGAYSGVDTGMGSRYPITIRRPKGTDPGVDYPVSVDIHAIAPSRSSNAWLYDSAAGYDLISSITFLSGETSKTIYLEYSTMTTTSLGTNGIEPFFVMLSNPFRAQPEHTLIQINFNRTADTSGHNSSLSSLSNAFVSQGYISPSSNSPYTVGSLVPIGVESGSGYGEWWSINSGMVLTMGGESLSPLQAGTTGKVVTFLYTVTEADVINGYLPEPTSLTGVDLINDPIGAGSYSYLKGSAPDLQSDFINAELIPRPKYGIVAADKATYDGSEEVTITVPLINSAMLASFPVAYPLGVGLTEWFKLSLDGGNSFISASYISYASGVITAKFPAPVNTSQQTEYCAEVFEIINESGIDVATAIPGAYVSFAVTTTTGVIVPVDSLTITGMPDRNIIRLDGQLTYQLGCVVAPASATFMGYTWSSSNPAVANVSTSGLLTAHGQGTAIITVTSDELDYHLQNGTTPELAKLTQSVTIHVGNVTANIIAIANHRNPSLGADGSLVIANINNLHLLTDDPFDIEYEITRVSDSLRVADGIINSTDDPELSFSFGGSSGQIPYAISEYVTGEYQPAYAVTLTAEDPLTNDPVIDTAYVNVYPPRPSVISSMDWTTHRLGEPITLPFTISGLDGNRFDVKIDVFEGASGGALIHSFVTDEADTNTAALPGLTKNTNGSLVSFSGSFTFTADTAGVYEIIVSALNDSDGTGKNTDSRSVRIRVADTDNANLTMTITDAFGNTVFSGNPGDKLPVTGVTLADITATARTDATQYDSAAAYELLQKANPYRRIQFSTPSEWLGSVMTVEGTRADWGFHVYFPAGREVEAALRWQSINKYIGLTFYQESFKDKVYVFQFPESTPSTPVTFSYINGAGILQTRVTELCDINVNGIAYKAAVINEPQSISGMVKISQRRVTGTDDNLYTAIVRSALSAEYAFADKAAVYTHQYYSHDFVRNNVPTLTYSATANIGFVDASFGGIRLPISGNVDVNYQIVDSQYRPVQLGGDYAETDLRGSLTTPGNGKVAIEYKPIMDNPEYMLLLEVVSSLYKPHLFIIDYDYLVRATGGQRIDVSLTMPLSVTNDNTGTLSISNLLIAYEDRDSNPLSVNSLGLGDNDTVLFGHMNPKMDVFVLLETQSHKESLSNAPDKRLVLTAPIVIGFYAGTFVTLYPDSATEYDSLSLFEGTYGRFTFDLAGLPLDTNVPNNFLSMGLINNENYMSPGSVGNRRIPNLMKYDFDRAEVKGILDDLDIPAPGKPKGGGGNTIDLEGAQNRLDAPFDVKNAMGDFAIDIPSAGLPFQFQVKRVGNEFEIKGVLSYNFIPGGDMVDAFESMREFETAFAQISNMVYSYTYNKPAYTQQRIGQGGSAFVGFRGYLVGKAVYDPKSDSFSIELSEGGVIAEVSASLSSRLMVLIFEIAFNVKGEMTSTLALRGPTAAEREASDAAVKVNFSLTNNVAVSLTASVAVGVDLWVAGAYAGIKGRAGGSHSQQIVYRPYLADNDSRQLQAGFKTTLEASLVAFARADLGCWTVLYEEVELVSGSVDFFTPNNQSNPYLNTSLSRNVSSFSVELMGLMTPLGTGYLFAFADDLRGNAMARLYNNGTIVAYRDEGDPDEYGDGRIMTSGISNHAPSVLKDSATLEEDVETVYGYDLSAYGSRAVAAWETLDEPPTQAELEGLDMLDILTPMFAKAEISASVYNGSSWSTPVLLSNNGMADVVPVTAINSSGSAAVVWGRGEFGISLDYGFSTYITGDLVCSLYNGSGWSEPIRLLQIPESLGVTSYNVDMDDSGNLVAAVSVQYKDTGKRSVYFISVAASDLAVTVRDICAEGFTPDIIWDGTKFVAAYSLDGVVYISSFAFGSGDILFAAETQMPVEVGAGFRLFRCEGKTATDSLMIMWSGIELDENANTESVLFAAKLIDRSGGDGIGLTAPIVVAKAPTDLFTASFDAYFDDNSITAAVVYAADDGGGCIVIEEANFANSLLVTDVYFAAEEVIPGNSLPVSFTVYNNGYSAISDVTIVIGGGSVSVTLADLLMPNSFASVVGLYTVPGTVSNASYTITASNGFALSGTLNLSQTDTGVITLSVDDTEDEATVMVSLFNASQLTPPAGSKLEVGVYRDIAGEYPAGYTTTVTNWNTLAEDGHTLSLSCDSFTEPTLLFVVAKTIGSDGSEIYDTNILNNSAAFTLRAQTPAETYTITFDPNGGTVTTRSVQTGADGKLTVLPTPTRSGNYSFNGWYTAIRNGVQVTTDYEFTSDTIVYARWTYSGGGGNSSNNDGNGSGSQTPSSNDNETWNTTDLASGVVIETPRNQDPIINNDGSKTMPGGGRIMLPNGTVIYVQAGAVISADEKSITTPKGSVGGTITHKNGQSFNMREDMVIIFNNDVQLGYLIIIENPFYDATGSDWYINFILFAYAHGLMNGTSEDPMQFSPNMPLTRGMIVTVLYRIAGNPDMSGFSNPFDDVQGDSYYVAAIKWAQANGIVNGYGGGRYGPEDNVTREQLATVLDNYAKYAQLSLPMSKVYNHFIDDADIAAYAKGSIERLFEAGIIDGYPDGSVKPQGQATRAEFAAMLMRFLEAVE